MAFSDINRLQQLFELAIAAPGKSNLYAEPLSKFHFDPFWKYCVALIAFHDVGNFAHLTLNMVNAQILKILEEKGEHAFAYISSQSIILILTNQTPNEAKRQVTAILSDFPDIWFDYSVGRSIRKIEYLRESYLGAEEILVQKKKQILPDNVVSYSEYELHKIISGQAREETLKHIHNIYLKPLISYDAVRGTEYVEFLATYLLYEGHLKEIADLMYIHKNTVLYKVHKIEEILDCDLSKMEYRIFLCIACMNYQSASLASLGSGTGV